MPDAVEHLEKETTNQKGLTESLKLLWARMSGEYPTIQEPAALIAMQVELKKEKEAAEASFKEYNEKVLKHLSQVHYVLFATILRIVATFMCGLVCLYRVMLHEHQTGGGLLPHAGKGITTSFRYQSRGSKQKHANNTKVTQIPTLS